MCVKNNKKNRKDTMIYERSANHEKCKTLALKFAWSLCSITKCRFCYSTHSGCVFIFFGFWTYVNLRLCVVSGTTPSATLSREHISRGSFEFARTLACLETPTNLRNVSFALESKFPDNSNHQTYPWKLDVWRARFRRRWASNIPMKAMIGDEPVNETSPISAFLRHIQ